MNPLLDKAYSDSLKRKQTSLFRQLPRENSSFELDLSSNSYLSLHRNQEVLKLSQTLLSDKLHGNLASRLVAQNSDLYTRLEDQIAQWKKCESALIFNSGYAANVGIISSLCSRNTHIFSDKLNHASIIDGSILSGAKLHRYRHNDINDLRSRLEQCGEHKEKLIVTDTVFSMDGDRAPLEDICQLASEHNATVMVDEAHATGIFGKTASGLVEETGTADGIHIRMGTLSKAVAGLGGFFAGSSALKDFFINNARSFIFSTGLPHSVLACNLASVKHIRSHPEKGQTLLNRAQEFRCMLKSSGFNTMDSTTHIVPVLIGDPKKTVSLSSFLKSFGIEVPPIRKPTVPQNTERLRFSLNLDVTTSDLLRITHLLRKWKK